MGLRAKPMVSLPTRIAYEIVNVVATAALDRPVDLESFHELFPQEVIHDQEIYGGRVAYYMKALGQQFSCSAQAKWSASD